MIQNFLETEKYYTFAFITVDCDSSLDFILADCRLQLGW